MNLKSVTISNFRSIRHATLNLDDHLTMLGGQNGSGKTGILDAIGTFLGSKLPKVSDYAVDGSAMVIEAVLADGQSSRTIRGSYGSADKPVKLIEGLGGGGSWTRLGAEEAEKVLPRPFKIPADPDPAWYKRLVEDLIGHEPDRVPPMVKAELMSVYPGIAGRGPVAAERAGADGDKDKGRAEKPTDRPAAVIRPASGGDAKGNILAEVVGRLGTDPTPDTVLMIDEPGTHQTPDRQARVVQMLRASGLRCVCATTSPAMLGYSTLAEIRLVLKDGGQTLVRQDDPGARAARINQVSGVGRASNTGLVQKLGYGGALLSRMAVLVESDHDKTILETADTYKNRDQKRSFATSGIQILNCFGKDMIPAAYVFLGHFGIPSYPVWNRYGLDSGPIDDAMNNAIMDCVGDQSYGDDVLAIRDTHAYFKKGMTESLIGISHRGPEPNYFKKGGELDRVVDGIYAAYGRLV